MNIDKIMELMQKGFTLLEALRQAIDAASPAIKSMYDLINKVKSGEEISDEDLEAVEAVLDAELARFNEPLDGT